jgi:dTDP-4-dehydrorhamnose 3,5-epimerase
MIFTETTLQGAFLIDLEKKEDERGFFARYFCQSEFGKMGLETNWVQINNSLSIEKGTLRGLHFQTAPFEEVKLVRCVRGAIWDVIVDLRKESVSFGHWFGAELTEANKTMIYVPKGFAHGFISLLPNTELIYLVSEYYNTDADTCLKWDDPAVDINWPIQPSVISDKDKRGLKLKKISL